MLDPVEPATAPAARGPDPAGSRPDPPDAGPAPREALIPRQAGPGRAGPVPDTSAGSPEAALVGGSVPEDVLARLADGLREDGPGVPRLPGGSPAVAAVVGALGLVVLLLAAMTVVGLVVG